MDHSKRMKVLVLGANGMLGSMVSTVLSSVYDVEMTIRPGAVVHAGMPARPIHRVNLLDVDELLSTLIAVRPDCVINCAGVIKQRSDSLEVLRTFPLNALFPHRLGQYCAAIGARMIHISTDCVFSGRTGYYDDNAPSDVDDVYGVSKRVGEVGNTEHVLTLRTSIIGHEASNHHSLIDWFLWQEGQVKGYRKAIYSGFPTVELARVLGNYILPRPEIHGVYNLSTEAISKYDLLKIVRDVYGKNIDILPDDSVSIDRSLNSTVLRSLLGYEPPKWQQLIVSMHETRPNFPPQA
ncbi:SDR family oxidoreductase [Sulfitobacter sp. R18_1]|uniref:dTDP-4-dehydrorhamnose reductase family protein n=1 Tax=Sulfitobacter sp. R18_1 TaxID=2821104 RepID=UPI001AD97DDC|nr:SDR family oxidoreductase [Sulfitobacter sp. R18_1]MBO9432186.1 SDR family oxidoreductase [Sulfitobacter sp. R18_1]